MSNPGFFLVTRGLLDHPRFKPQHQYSDFEAWYWLIEAASHTARDVGGANGRHRITIHLEPGQLSFSVRFLAMKWRWSDKRVQRFLSALKIDRLLTTNTTTGQTVITICNWAENQRRSASVTVQTATQSTPQATTQMATKKKELEELKELNDVVGTRAREEKIEEASKEAISLGNAFLQAAGFKDYDAAPLSWYALPVRAPMWIEAGWSTEMIVKETERIARCGGEPKSIYFFEMVFAKAFALAQHRTAAR